jgi:hypothetical protein
VPFKWGGASAAEAFGINWTDGRRGSRLVTAFVRLSLFPDQVLDFRGDVVERFRNVVRELSSSEDELWKDYAHKVRKNVKRVVELGLSVERDANARRLPEFLGIYEQTMHRRSARQEYSFGRPFFERLIAQLPKCIQFFHVLSEGRVVSTELVVAADHVHSSLGGTLKEALELRANDLLKHEIIRWAREAGKKTFVPGGGYDAADGIFRYKLSFAPKGARPFRVGTRVFDRAACDRLISRRSAWEREQGRDWIRQKAYSRRIEREHGTHLPLSAPRWTRRARALVGCSRFQLGRAAWSARGYLRAGVHALGRRFSRLAHSNGTAALPLSVPLRGVATGDEVLVVADLRRRRECRAVCPGRDEAVT